MELSETQQRIIKLGNLLVDCLGTGPQVDTFSRWVAHYVAELMVVAENATGAQKNAAEERCLSAIMKLWSHRLSFPSGARPLEEFEPIMRALAELDPNSPRSVYHLFHRKPEIEGEATEVLLLVDFVIRLDRAARVLIEIALSTATEKAIKPETKLLLENAMPSEMKSDIDVTRELIRRRAVYVGLDDPEASLLHRKEWLEHLKEFRSLCEGLEGALTSEIDLAK